MTQDEGLVEEVARELRAAHCWPKLVNDPDDPTMINAWKPIARAVTPLITRKVEERVLRDIHDALERGGWVLAVNKVRDRARCEYGITLDHQGEPDAK